ncbi:MAG: BatD family protein [Candidatus Sericytochromatia bacterium]
MSSYRIKANKVFTICFLFILFCPSAFSASFVASVDKTKITLEDSINLSLTASGGTASEPDIPETKSLEFIPRGTSSQMQITNGSFSSSESFNYQVNPKATGKLIIPSITTEIDGKKYTTQAITIEVNESIQRKDIDTSKNTFVSVHVNNKKPYVNEQVIYTFRFFTKVQTDLNEIKYPDFKGFFVEDINNAKKETYEQIINGEKYLVLEVNKALYPTKSGEIVIKPLDFFVEVLYQDDSMGGIFSTTRKEVENFKTKAIKLDIQPLPNPPNNFSGIVAKNLIVQSKIDNNLIKSGDSANLEVNVSGVGNITDLKKFPLNIPDIKIYNDKSTEESNFTDEKLTWSKKFKYALVPLKKGQITIPESSIIYFNTTKKSYEKASIKPSSIISDYAEQSLKSDIIKKNEQNTISAPEDEISPIIEGKEINNQSLSKNTILFGYTFFLISLFFIIYLYKFSGKISFTSINNKKSNNKLIKQINSEQSLEKISKLFREYLNSRFNINDFNEDSIRQNIKDPNITNELIKLINDYNFLKFSGISDKTKENEIVNNTKRILEKIT